jgi:phage-related tail protein
MGLMQVSVAVQFGHPRPKTPDEIKAEKDQAKRMNEERQRHLKEDTDKLLKLATELKEYVDKTNENILSLDVLRKSEEIEKVAKSVREKMKTYYAPEEEQQPSR